MADNPAWKDVQIPISDTLTRKVDFKHSTVRVSRKQVKLVQKYNAEYYKRMRTAVNQISKIQRLLKGVC